MSTSSPLSFEPMYHKQVTIEGVTGWTPVMSLFVDLKRIIEEQWQIEREGGSLIIINPKGDPSFAENIRRLVQSEPALKEV